MARRDQQKKPNLGSIVSLFIALAFLEPRLLVAIIPFAILGGGIWLAIRAVKNGGTPKYSATSRQKSTFLDDCSIPLSMHRDKGSHHVRKGRGQDPWDNLDREIDPWDRPDIDIRKYQRNR